MASEIGTKLFQNEQKRRAYLAKSTSIRENLTAEIEKLKAAVPQLLSEEAANKKALLKFGGVDFWEEFMYFRHLRELTKKTMILKDTDRPTLQNVQELIGDIRKQIPEHLVDIQKEYQK